MESPGTDLELVRCPDCDAISLRTAGDDSPCCERPVERLDPDAVPIESPALEDILGVVFGMTGTELDVCMCVMEGGEVTTSEIAERIGVDRSHVSRHLNHLVDLGVLEKQERLLERGGRVHVYSPADLETVRRNFTLGLFAWWADAVEEVEEISREKVEAITELTGDTSERVVYHDRSDGKS